MLVTWRFILGLAALSITIHLEGLRILRKLPKVYDDYPRIGVLSVVMICLLLHVLEISFYAAGFALDDKVFHAGQFNDESNLGIIAYFYYSAITYTAVGYGDILPTGAIRLLAVAEFLSGLLLIGWSGAFTFIAMEKLWSDRAMERREARSAARKIRRDGRAAVRQQAKAPARFTAPPV